MTALGRSRRMRIGVIELLFVTGGVVLGVLLPRISAGPSMGASGVSSLMGNMAAAMITFIGLVFSLLFLVVQFGSTTWTPRLNLFRDNPLVWTSFGYFVGVVVWAAVASMVVSSLDQVSVIVPVVGVALVLAGLGVFRKLQMTAFESIQLAPILDDVGRRGRAVIEALYPVPYQPEPTVPADLADVRTEVRWSRPNGILRQIHLPGLVEAAADLGGIVELKVRVGDVVREGDPVLVVRGGAGSVDAAKLFETLDVGLERTIEQDLRFAFRLLADIALRALSPAINDQTTGMQVIDSMDALLAPIAVRELDIGQIRDAAGRLQVIIAVPTWEDYVDGAIADIARSGREIEPINQRLVRLVDDIAAIAPAQRQAPLIRWRRYLIGTRSPADAESGQ